MPSKNNSRGAVSLIVIILLALVSLSVWWLSSQGKLSFSLSLPTIKTEDPIANWKTYSTSDVGFSIKLPNNWYSEENKDFQEPVLNKNVLEVKVQFSNYKLPFKGSVGSIPKGCHFDILVADTDMSLDQFLDKNPGPIQGSPDKQESIKIQGKPAIKRIYLPNQKNIGEEKTILYTSSNGRVFAFYYFSELEEQTASCETIFSQILSSFKFLD